jgi:hypothetical protein
MATLIARTSLHPVPVYALSSPCPISPAAEIHNEIEKMANEPTKSLKNKNYHSKTNRKRTENEPTLNPQGAPAKRRKLAALVHETRRLLLSAGVSSHPLRWRLQVLQHQIWAGQGRGAVHHRHAIGEGERFLDVVRDEQESDADASLQGLQFATHRLSEVRVERRWTGGPTVELHLPVRLSVEFDALYRSSRANRVLPLRFDPALNPSLHFMGEETKVWDFPLLLKHRLTGGSVRPFVSAGASWSHRRNEGNSLGLCMGPEGSCYPPEFPFFRFGGVYKSSNTRFGPAGGAGFELRTEHVTITPEVRWNHWSGNNRRHVAVSWGSRSAAN